MSGRKVTGRNATKCAIADKRPLGQKATPVLHTYTLSLYKKPSSHLEGRATSTNQTSFSCGKRVLGKNSTNPQHGVNISLADVDPYTRSKENADS